MSHDRILVMDEAGGPESSLVQLLWRRGYEVRWALWPADTSDFAGWRPDEIIVALDGWEGRGLEVCREVAAIPEFRRIPLLAVSAFESLADRCAALAAGALDVIRMPPDPLELEFKVKAHVRLFRIQRDDELHFGDLRLDQRHRRATLPASRAATSPEHQVLLTDQETRLLAHLIARAGRPALVEDILVEVFGHPPRCGDPEIVRDKIRHLRRKLERDPKNPERILTLTGRGYYLAKHDAP